ncbi:hypothetical protein D3C76_1673320 [compost metagenome]
MRLVWMPSFSSCSAARMPSQVEASLISTRSLETPAASYSPISWRALFSSAGSSNDRRASTSVEIRPGITLRMPEPTATANLSQARSTSPLASAFTCLSRSA